MRVGGRRRLGDVTPGQVFGARLREVRESRRWTQIELAARLEDLGHPVSQSKLAKIEKGATSVKYENAADKVNLADVLAIAYALDVCPLHLFCPVEQEPRVEIVRGRQPLDPEWLREWVRGEREALGQDPKVFFAERPRVEIEADMEAVRAVRIGRETTHGAFFTRQALAERGELPPIDDDEKEEQQR
jgi:transcriptional regulator with XRE-family HTH domain